MIPFVLFRARVAPVLALFAVFAAGRLAAAGRLNSSAPPEAQAAELNAELSRDGAQPDAYARVEGILQRWSEANPEAALRYALQGLTDAGIHSFFVTAAGNVMESWARRDPVAARMFFETLGDSPEAAQIAASFIQGYGSSNPEGAMSWVHSIMGDPNRKDLHAALAKGVVGVLESSGRRQEARLWLAKPDVASEGAGESASGDLARRIARRNPQEAIAFCRTLPQDSRARLISLQEAVRQWAFGDPGGAGKWLSGISRPSSSAGPAASSPSAGAWSASEIDFASAGYAVGVSGLDPKMAQHVLEGIANPDLKASVIPLLGGRGSPLP